MKRSTIYLLTTISVILGFGFFHLLYSDLSSGIWVFPSMFVFLASVPILCIGCVFGLALCLLKKRLLIGHLYFLMYLCQKFPR